MPVSFLESPGLRLLLLGSVVWAAGSCGGGDDVTGPPGPPAVATVQVTPGSVTLAPGEQVQLDAILKAQDGTELSGRTVTWEASDPAVATVEASGMVTASTAGTAVVTATSEGKSGSATVTVSAVSVAAVEVIPNPASVAVGQSAQLAVVLRDGNGSELSGRTVTWSSSDEAVATVSATGLVNGLATGAATITATSEGKSGSTALSVSAVSVATVEVAPPQANLLVGASVQLAATAKDAGGAVLPGRPATWTTSDVAVARVNPAGLVTGMGGGTATIVATIEGRTGSATIAVTQQPVATITVTPDPSSVAVQQNLQLTATLKADGGTELTGRVVTWESSNQSVATVSATGLVQGVAPGTATIRARSEGKTGTTALTVTQTLQPVATVTVAPNNGNQVAVQGTLQFSATLKAADGTVLTGRGISWSSSNDAVARINANGLATGIAPGTVTITATSEGKTGTASLTVTPISGITRTWRGGASGRPSDWSFAANWTPAGTPISLDTVLVPVTTNPAVLSQDAQIARLLISGGQLRLAARLNIGPRSENIIITAANSPGGAR